MKIDFFEEHHRLLEDPAHSPFGEYARALEELGARLSGLAGGCLQALHASDYPFAVALRPYYYMSALQFANVLDPAFCGVSLVGVCGSVEQVVRLLLAR